MTRLVTKPDTGTLSQWQLIRLAFARHRLAMFSMRVLMVLYIVALFAELFMLKDPAAVSINNAYCPPQMPRWSWTQGIHAPAMVRHVSEYTLRVTYTPSDQLTVPLAFFPECEPYQLLGLIPLRHRLFGVDERAWEVQVEKAGMNPSIEPNFYPFGADRYGRCIFSRAVAGSRVSLSIGLIGIFLTFVLGVTIGGISGYVGGFTDNVIQRTIEIINSIPSLPLWITLAAIFPPEWSPLQTYFSITVMLSLLGWTGLARVVRGKILSLREEDYAVAARLLGASHGRVLFRHLLPGFTSHIIVVLTLSIPGMILGETALSFLGLGLRDPVVSWGVMLQDCFDIKAVRYYPWLLLPVVFVIITVLSFNFVGDGMRDAADPYTAT